MTEIQSTELKAELSKLFPLEVQNPELAKAIAEFAENLKKKGIINE